MQLVHNPKHLPYTNMHITRDGQIRVSLLKNCRPKPIVDSRRLYSRFSCRWNGSRRPTFVIWDVDYLDTYLPYTDHDWFTENNICETEALANIAKISHTRIQIGLQCLLSLVICIFKHLSCQRSVLFHLKSVLLDNLFCKSKSLCLASASKF